MLVSVVLLASASQVKQILPTAIEVENRAAAFYAGVRAYDDDVNVYDVDFHERHLIAKVTIHYRAPKEYRVVYRWIREGATTTATQDAKGRKHARTAVWRHPLRGQLRAKDLNDLALSGDPTWLLQLAMEPVAKPTANGEYPDKVWAERENGRLLYCVFRIAGGEERTYYDAKTGEIVKTRRSWAHHMSVGDELTVFHPRLARKVPQL